MLNPNRLPSILSQMALWLLSSDIMDGDMDRMHLAKCNLCPHQFTFRGSGETAKHETASKHESSDRHKVEFDQQVEKFVTV